MTKTQTLFEQAQHLQNTGKITEAISLYLQILPDQKNNPQLLYHLGTACLMVGDTITGVKHLQQSLMHDPNNPFVLNNLGIAFRKLNQFEASLSSYAKALNIKPNYAEAYNNHGNTLRLLKRMDEALISYAKAISIRPGYVEALNNQGLVLKELGRFEEALACWDQVLQARPQYGEACYNRGIILHRLKRFDEALNCFDQVLKLRPDHIDAQFSRGNALLELNRTGEAISSFERVLKIRPGNIAALNNLGVICLGLKQFDQALNHFDQALNIEPAYAESLLNRGNALRELKRHEEAVASYEKAIAIRPHHFEAYNNLGLALQALKRTSQALECLNQALKIRPDFADAHLNRGNLLQELKRPEEAISCYEKAFAIRPNYTEAFNNKGNVLRALKRLDEAVACYQHALSIDPEFEFLLGSFLHTKMHICDWDSLPIHLATLERKILAFKPAIVPFQLFGLTDSPELQHKTATCYANYQRQEPAAVFLPRENSPRSKIRVGYYSADFFNHATAVLMVELFEVHDRSDFEWYAFSFGPGPDDDMRRRLALTFDQFIDVRDKSDAEIVRISRENSIDIAVDLKGYTSESRSNIFTLRAAPIQVSYMGFTGTLGTPHVDYIIADKTVIPPENHKYYTEKVVYLPNSYMVNDSKREISDRCFSRQEVGLPDTGFVFCCFNNNYKITPETFDGWMRILKKIQGSVIWLLEDNPFAVDNLRKQAKLRGVDASRLVFAKRMKLDDHLARHRLADLFLDTFPCNAHTTASDALWAGLPVLTLMGRSFSSRVAASLLHAVGLPELITHSQEEFERKAIEMALSAATLLETKKKLARNRHTTTLFDGKIFARHMEAGYKKMHERHQKGLTPEAIEVFCSHLD